VVSEQRGGEVRQASTGLISINQSVRPQRYQRKPGKEQVAQVDAHGGDIVAGLEG